MLDNTAMTVKSPSLFPIFSFKLRGKGCLSLGRQISGLILLLRDCNGTEISVQKHLECLGCPNNSRRESVPHGVQECAPITGLSDRNGIALHWGKSLKMSPLLEKANGIISLATE